MIDQLLRPVFSWADYLIMAAAAYAAAHNAPGAWLAIIVVGAVLVTSIEVWRARHG